MRKKIALMISEINWDFQETITKKIIECANALNYDVVVICTYGSFNDNQLYADGEKAAITLADYSTFDGIIAAEDLFDVPGMADEFYDIVKKNAKCPIVYLRTIREGCYSILVDNSTSMTNMVRHFTDVHGFRNICYMSGKKGWRDTQQRLDAYLSVMAENGIPVDEHMIFHGDFWRRKGAEALDWFLNGSDDYPEAIVCANDYMALSILEELEKRGIKVPEQVCVSGFDYIDEANICQPTLTTLALNFEELAAHAVDIIDKANNNIPQEFIQYTSTRMILQGSCGCNSSTHSARRISHLVAYSQHYVNDTKDVMTSALEYQDSFTPPEFMSVAFKYRQHIRSDKAFFCFNNREEKNNIDIENDNRFTETMRLRDIFDKDKSIKKNIVFPRKNLLPDEYWSDDKPNNYFFYVLHFQNKVYGYMVTEMPTEGWFNIYTQAYLVNLSNALENSSVHNKLTVLNEIRDLYQKDPLTGIYNRRGFDKLYKAAYYKAQTDGTNFALVSIDIDNLKPINDNFGHTAGDNAITVLASTLYRLMDDDDFCGRVGGDEFLAVLQMNTPDRAVEFKKQFLAALVEESSKISDYSVSASVGICEFAENPSISLMNMLKIVDERLYAEKREKKAH